MPANLSDKINSIINYNGFITIDEFMTLSLTDKDYGYYQIKKPIGKTNDFITSPEVSQLFGEMLAFWLINIWQQLGEPKEITLIELGPGRGTLMLDLLNIVKKIPELYTALEIVLIDINQTLIEEQKQKLSKHKNITWHSKFSDMVINNPFCIIANEFFDVLPVKQFKYMDNNWHEVVIKKATEHSFEFILDKNSSVFINKLIGSNVKLENGMVFEYSPACLGFVKMILNLLYKYNGAILIIDYGYQENAFKSTLQAMKNHKLSNFLSYPPGNLDLSYLINFPLIVKLIKQASDNDKYLTHNIKTQRDFLLSLGINLRLEKLLTTTFDMSKKNAIISGVNRIINSKSMGILFKALEVKYNC